MPARAPHDSQHEENTGDTLANLRKEKGKFEFIGTKEFDALDQDRVFLQQVADQHTYMEEHNSLPPERSFRRGDRASPRDSFGIAGNMASRATKLELTREQRIERQTHSIGKIIRVAHAAKRSLGGMVVKDTESLFKAIDKATTVNVFKSRAGAVPTALQPYPSAPDHSAMSTEAGRGAASVVAPVGERGKKRK